MRIAYFSITEQGRYLAESLSQEVPGTLFGKENLKLNMQQAFSEYDGLVCIMATGIVVRVLAPLFVHKQKDPAVVVMDSKGQFAISLLSGHLGGANALAQQMAVITGGQAVITTATDVENAFAFDMFAKRNNLKIENIEELKYISSEVLKGKRIQLLSDYDFDELTDDLVKMYDENCQDPVVVISDRIYDLAQKHILYLRPACLWIGIGCKAGVSGERILEAVRTVFERNGLSTLSIRGISTIPKKEKEAGIIENADYFGANLTIISIEQINQLDLDRMQIKRSEFVKKTVGAASVSTASAYIAANYGEILVDKEVFPGITVSIVRQRL
ncbi:MAG: cobalt-precorrin 5A hydrolase [Lachnospiraceae bacterium]|nr:cobalt-precorrin 5A hydrolase [Lachnospiraceae bacterium]